ncbi:hypothetical protein TURU_021116 [Turdus rufiventris]|nr:hypothetical protein TURU_021116 [Turdus rufiventris]
MSVNITRIVIQALQEERLSRECNRRQQVIGVLNDLYAAAFLRLSCLWKQQHGTVTNASFFLKGFFPGALSTSASSPQFAGVLPAMTPPKPEVPVVFLCSHQSQVDGLLLSFVLLSQGIGLPRVAVGAWTSPRLRSLLQRLGGIFLPSQSELDDGLPGAVLDAYVQEVLRSRQPLVLFLEEPPASLQLADSARRWLHRVLRALRDGAVPDVLIVPVGIAYDVAPGRMEQDGVVVLLPQLMWDFSELLEQLLLRGRAVGFSGQLRALVGHSLRQLQPPLAPHPLRPPRASPVPPKALARTWLGRLAGGVRHHLAGEAVGACAIRALLLEVLPILGSPSSLTRIVLSRDELLHKILELLQLLPPTLLGLQPCQPPDCHSLDILDKLILGGLLEEEELSEPQGFPGFLLFLCRLLSPILQTYGRAVEFLERPPWPQPEADYVQALLEFLAEDEDGYPDRSLALSSLQSFKDMGVLEELQTPTGPLLQLSQPFQSASNRKKLEAFIHQFTQL